VSSNYNGNKIISGQAQSLQRPGTRPAVRPRSHFALNPTQAVEIGGLAEIEESTRLAN
jgi:hypothetical protein